MKKSSTIFLLILVLIAGISGFFYFNNTKKNIEEYENLRVVEYVSPSSELKTLTSVQKMDMFSNLIAAKNGEYEPEDILVEVSIETPKHVKGLYQLVKSDYLKVFLAVKIGEDWEIIYEGTGQDINCDGMEIYNFPMGVLNQCAKE